MKLMHLADLHLGKRMYGYSLYEDQKYILDQAASLAEENKVDSVLIAGDVFDKPNPSSEATSLLDGFLTRLAANGIKVFLISGNHDSALRLAYGSGLFEKQGIHISSLFDGRVKKHVLSDEWGETAIWMVPFTKPSMTQIDGKTFRDYPEMFEAIIDQVDFSGRNILMAHQFFAGAKTCQSEEITVGTLDNIPSELIQKFDYAALGHIHSPQKAGGEHCRYAGTLLKYSISEIPQTKSIPLIEIKDEVSVSFLPVSPLHDVKKIKGRLEELISPEFLSTINTEDYIYALLTDEKEQLQAASRLREVYPRLIRMEYESLTGLQEAETDQPEIERKSWMDMMDEFYQRQSGNGLDDGQKKILETLWEEVHV